MLSAFLVGLLFGTGLLVSGMTDPFKVIGFLDIAGPWDPSLAFVMIGAVIVGLIAFRLAGPRAAPLRVRAVRVVRGQSLWRLRRALPQATIRVLRVFRGPNSRGGPR